MFAVIEYSLLAIILFLVAGSLLNLSSHPHWFIRGLDFPRVQIIVIGWLAVLLYFAFRSLAGGSSSFSSWWLVGPAIALTLWHGFRILPYTPIFRKQAKPSTRSSQKRSTKRNQIGSGSRGRSSAGACRILVAIHRRRNRRTGRSPHVTFHRTQRFGFGLLATGKFLRRRFRTVQARNLHSPAGASHDDGLSRSIGPIHQQTGQRSGGTVPISRRPNDRRDPIFS